MNLSAEERETIISYNDAEDTVRIWTAMRTMQTILNKSSVAKLVKETEYGKTYEVPLENFKLASALRKPRQMSEEARKAAGDRMRQMHEWKKESNES